MERRLKRKVVITLYLLCSLLFCISLVLVEKGFKPKEEDINYVNNVILNKEIPVNKSLTTIIRPYNSLDIEILNSYYDINADADSQKNSIITYNNTYMQNTGVIYGADNSFDVIAIYDGEVIRVEDTDLLGKIVEIRHSNNVVSIYQLLDNVVVNKGATIKQGDKIGTSSLSNILNDNKYKLYFELAINGKLVNGEQYYGKPLEEI